MLFNLYKGKTLIKKIESDTPLFPGMLIPGAQAADPGFVVVALTKANVRYTAGAPKVVQSIDVAVRQVG